MEIELIRTKSTLKSFTGKLAVDGIFQCYTVERPENDPVHPAIPEGKYPVRIRDSLFWSKHGYAQVPGIFEVPGRKDIEIHPANFPTELEGCVAVGQKQGEDAVFDSRLAFDPLLNKILACKDPIFIIVKKEILNEPTKQN